MQTIAVIPARGGSKGIPRKNLVDLCGKPLIAWSVEQARISRYVDRVIVSTDCDEIGNVAEQWGAEYWKRPAELAGDTSPSEDALLHVLDLYRIEQGRDPRLIVFLQATSPIRQPWDIDSCIGKLDAAGADSIFSACEVHGYTWKEVTGCLCPEYLRRTPRQEKWERRLEENGSIYVMRPDVLRKGNRFGGRVACHEMHPLDSLQIDEPQDLETFRYLMPLRLGPEVAA